MDIEDAESSAVAAVDEQRTCGLLSDIRRTMGDSGGDGQ